MDILLYIYISSVILTILFICGIFIPKNEFIKTISIIATIILTLLIAYMKFTSFPNNFIWQRALAIAVGILPIIPIILLFIKKINKFVFKLIISAILIINVLLLIFF